MPLEPNDKGEDTGEVYLRLKWHGDKTECDKMADSSGFVFDVQLEGIGISVIESSVFKLPREIMVTTFKLINCIYISCDKIAHLTGSIEI